MICHSQDAETSGILHIAQSMCVAARTAPKARGVDHIDSCYLTGDEKEALAAEMDRLGREQDRSFDELAAFMEAEGLSRRPGWEEKHHEIYLSDPRRAKPERLKTVLRIPV